jgi:hypothetical protein
LSITMAKQEPANSKSLNLIMVPGKVMGKTGLSHGARLLYGCIYTRFVATGAQELEIPAQSLREPLVVSARQLSRYVNELVAAGFIATDTQPGGRPNIYKLLGSTEGE